LPEDLFEHPQRFSAQALLDSHFEQPAHHNETGISGMSDSISDTHLTA
jgi:hypothetical protein